MDQEATIRDHLAAYLSSRGMSINQFSEQSGINSGTLSRIINGHQPIAMNHLERLTRGMGLPEDHFYSLYVDECLYYSAPTWRRLRPFILHCAELNRLDCIRRIVENLLDNLIYAPMLFDVAEDLFTQGLLQAAALLYENVSASEKYQYAERLALCQYRLFVIALGADQRNNLRAAILFESYVPRLHEADQLDALKALMHVYYSLQRWQKVNELSLELLRLATILYDFGCSATARPGSEKMPEKPVYFYILYAHLVRSGACVEWGDYASALDIVPLYMDGSWIQEDSEEVRATLTQFRTWGEANTFLYRLLAGQEEVIPEYVEYIADQPSEIFMAVYRIVQTANRYRWNVDHVLERFSGYIFYRTDLAELGTHNQQIIAGQYAGFLAELADYYLYYSRKEGINFILLSLESSSKMNSEGLILKCVGLFEQYREEASAEEKTKYKLLIREVQDANDKKTGDASCYV